MDIVRSIFPSLTVTGLACCLLVTTCICGDHLLLQISSTDWSGNSHVIRAMTDSSVHALIGALSWAVTENSGLLYDWKRWLNCIFCAFLASCVDLDHFLAAGSIDLKKALNLTVRPYFHNTSLIPLVVTSCWILGQSSPALKVFSLMFSVSWLSHHLRDANHRGLWLFPFGHTPAFPSYFYITLILILSLSVRTWYYYIVISV